MATYAEKLKDPRWQKMRLKVLERDRWACKSCGSGDITLHVHHWYYKQNADPWEYPIESLETLCADCHEIETILRPKEEQSLIRILRERGYSAHDVDELVILIGLAAREDLLEFVWSANKRGLWKNHPGSESKTGLT